MENVCCGCGNIKYYNPIPVVVALVKVIDENGKRCLLGVRRGIEPKKGFIAFPGGFQEIETPHEALIRELWEETGIDLSAVKDSIFHDECKIRPATGNGRILIFYKCKHTFFKSQIDMTFKNSEVEELVLIDRESELAWPTHQEMIEWGLE
jgi:8-oxo-dGTP pyrophosphatase MutT (NUDIX family)